MIETLALFITGLFLLIEGSNYFVDASARIARKLGVSDLIIGLTLTAVGTSLPEFASAITSTIRGQPGLIIGNITGSNIANIGLICSLSAIIGTFGVSKRIYLRDGYMMIFSALAFFVFSYDGEIQLLEALSLIFLYALYIMFLIQTRSNRTRSYKFHDFLQYFFDFGYITTIKSSLLTQKPKTVEEKKMAELFKEGLIADVLIMAISMLAIVTGAHYLVKESVAIANSLNVPVTLIGLSLVSIGTTLPELSVSIAAARKRLGGIIIGNVIGSNIANILLIGGTSAALHPLSVSRMSVLHTIPIMGFFTLAFLLLIERNERLTRKEGIIGITAYILFIAYAVHVGIT